MTWALYIPLRLIRVQLKGGESEMLVTSLLVEEAYPRAWFKPLYHLRWGVKEGYKRENGAQILTGSTPVNLGILRSVIRRW